VIHYGVDRNSREPLLVVSSLRVETKCFSHEGLGRCRQYRPHASCPVSSCLFDAAGKQRRIGEPAKVAVNS
jgi:hypothetical protein